MFISRFPAWFPTGRTLMTVVASALVGGAATFGIAAWLRSHEARNAAQPGHDCAFRGAGPSLSASACPGVLTGLGPGSDRPRFRPACFGSHRSGREELDVWPNRSFRQARRSRAWQDRAREHQRLRRHASGANRLGGGVARVRSRTHTVSPWSFVLCPLSLVRFADGAGLSVVSSQ